MGERETVSLCHFPGLSCLSPRVMPTLASQTVAAPQGEAPDHQAEESQEDRGLLGKRKSWGYPGWRRLTEGRQWKE